GPLAVDGLLDRLVQAGGDGRVVVSAVVVELPGDDSRIQDLQRLGDVRVVLADEHVDPSPGLGREEQVAVAVRGNGLDVDGEAELGGRGLHDGSDVNVALERRARRYRHRLGR